MVPYTLRTLPLIAALTLFALAGCGTADTPIAPRATSAPPTVPASAPATAPPSGTPRAATPGTGATPAGTATRSPVGTPTRAATPGAAATATRAGSPRATASSGQVATVAIRAGQSAVLPEHQLTLDFVAVQTDSRCPRSGGGVYVACAWAGEAKITVGATRGGTASWFTLTIPGLTDDTSLRPDDPKTYTVFAGYKIQLASLEPQPTADGGKPGEYMVTLLVSKAS